MAASRREKWRPFFDKTKCEKGTEIMTVAGACGLIVAAYLESASPHEIKLVEATIETSFVVYVPERLIGDKAYDGDGLDHHLKERYRTNCDPRLNCQQSLELAFQIAEMIR